MIRQTHKRFAAIALATMIPSVAMAAQPITGRWTTADNTAVIVIASCGTKLCGKISKLLKVPPKGPPVDSLNPNPSLRTRPLAGLPILTDLVPSGDGWTGTVYDPKKGKTYRAFVTRDPSGALKVKGCIGNSPFCQTMLWQPAS
jgi:uncharacterized protein (DUF2147 family)